MRTLLLSAAASLAVAMSAHASVIPALESITPDGSNFVFTYEGQLAPDQGVTAGDMLVIVDFAGYVPGSVQSSLSDVTASVSNTLPAGLLLDPGFSDNPTIPDLVFTYTGPDFQVSGGPFATQVNFDGLSAESTLGGTTSGSFSAEAVKNDGGSPDTPSFNVGEVVIPSALPEPLTWAMMLAGFGAIGVSLRAHRARQAALA